MKPVIMILLAAVLVPVLAFFQKLEATAGDEAGRQYIYSYKSESTGYSDIKRMYSTDSSTKTAFFKSESLQSLQMNISCSIRETIISAASEERTSCFELLEPQVSIHAAEGSFETESIRYQLTRPVFARISRDGKILSVSMDTAVSYTSADMLKEILSHLQFVHPARPAAHWQTSEENVYGTFTAQYTRVGQPDSLTRYRKTNNGYTALRSARGQQRIIADSKTIIRVDSAGHIHGLSSSESQYTVVDKDTISASGNSVELVMTATALAEKDELVALSQLGASRGYGPAVSLSAGLSDEELNRLAYKNTLGEDGFETLMQRVRQPLNDEQQNQLVLQFRALAYLYPQNCRALENVLRTAPFNSTVYQVISTALADTKNKQAVDALANVIRQRKHEPELVIRVLPVLATTSSPTANAVAVTKQLAVDSTLHPDVISTAQLALAGLCYELRRTDSSQSVLLARYIMEMMANEPDSIQRILVLGNTGSPEVFPILSSYIGNKKVSAPVQAAATGALRLIPIKNVDVLLKQLSAGRQAEIAAAAKVAMAFRDAERVNARQ